MPQSLVEKIATRHAARLGPAEPVRAGDVITIRPKHVMSHDNTSAVMQTFRSIGAERVEDPRQPVFAIDHDIQNVSPENLGMYARIESFAGEHGIDFHPAGTGIAHQIMVEGGYVTPDSMVVGADPHANMYGAIGALGTPVVETDAASIWATGTTWWEVPQVARVELQGKLRPGVVGKDVIIALCGVFNQDEVLNMAIEFTGDGVASLSVDQRMTVANMTTEWGAVAGVFPFDDVLRIDLLARADELAAESARFSRDDVETWFSQRLIADDDAHYAVELTLNLDTVVPHVSGPEHVNVTHALPDIEARKVRVNKAYLLSCVNGRLEDLESAAAVVSGQQVAEDVEFYVAAASARVERAARESGAWARLLAAGAIELPPGCGACIGLGRGTLEPGDVAISATNRNVSGQMGSPDAEAYLASPAVVAASAVAGYIRGPEPHEALEPSGTMIRRGARPSRGGGPLLDGYPRAIGGRLLWLPADGLDAHDICSAARSSSDDESRASVPAGQASDDAGFDALAESGDVLVAGANFGSGTSREEAATCLRVRGIPCVIADSFSATYKRIALNSGLIAFECPGLVEHLRVRFSNETAPIVVGPEVEIDFEASSIALADSDDGERFVFAPLSPVVQELIVAGGSEAVVRRRLAAGGRA